MKKINISNAKSAARRLIRATPDNCCRDSKLYRCDKFNGRIFIARLENGRPGAFVEVVAKKS